MGLSSDPADGRELEARQARVADGRPSGFSGLCSSVVQPEIRIAVERPRQPRENSLPRSQRLLGYGPNVIREFCGIPKA